MENQSPNTRPCNSELAEFAVDLLGASDWQHRVRIFNDDMEAAVAWLTSTIK